MLDAFWAYLSCAFYSVIPQCVSFIDLIEEEGLQVYDSASASLSLFTPSLKFLQKRDGLY